MRLTKEQLRILREEARRVFGAEATVRLFGSRLDDTARGGDIDLLIETPQALSPAEQVERRTRYVARLYRALEEQRIDVLITAPGEPDPRAVVAEAKRTGILLTQT